MDSNRTIKPRQVQSAVNSLIKKAIARKITSTQNKANTSNVERHVSPLPSDRNTLEKKSREMRLFEQAFETNRLESLSLNQATPTPDKESVSLLLANSISHLNNRTIQVSFIFYLGRNLLGFLILPKT